MNKWPTRMMFNRRRTCSRHQLVATRPALTWLRLLLLGGFLIFLTAPALFSAERYHPSRLLVKPLRGREGALDRFHKQGGHRLLRRLSNLDNVEIIELPAGKKVAEALQAYRQAGLCEFAEPDYQVWPAATPNDPRFLDGSLWHLHNTGQSGGLADADLDAPEAWDTRSSASNIIVAIIDTGVRYTHEDLAPNMWVNANEIPNNGLDDDLDGYIDDVYGVNVANGSGDPIDVEGHGTQVAGFIGARGNNAKGVTGVAWAVRIMACRFYDDSGLGFISDAALAINYARQHGAKVINASFITTDYSVTLYTAINQCRTNGVIVVTAAGNDSVNTDAVPYYPGSYDLDNIVTVLATTRQDGLSSFSNYGVMSTDLGAPGSSVYTTLNLSDSAYGLNSGTSFSAPIVAGAFALMCARYPSESYLQLIDRVNAAVDPLPALQGKCRTGGRLNLAKALGPSVAADFEMDRTAGSAPFTVNFTNTSIGSLASGSWDFGDGTFSSDFSPQHTYTNAGEYTVTLQIQGTNGLASSRSRPLSALAGYAVSAGSYAWIDPTGMTALQLGNNEASAAIPLPFAFHFYGQTYSNLYVGADGLIGFDPLSLPINTSLPNSAAPNNLICPFWDDLRPATAGAVYVGATGIAPTQQFVISWVGVRHGTFPYADYTFQAVLFEGSDKILFQYQTVTAVNGNAGREGRSATIGLENRSGEVATLFSYNGSSLLQNGQALMFEPHSQTSLIVSPGDGLAVTGEVGQGLALSNRVYRLYNTSGGDLDWRVHWDVAWLDCTPSQGTLANGQSTNILIRLTDAAQQLPPGTYNEGVEFEDLATGESLSRTVTLTVTGNSAAILQLTIVGSAPTFDLKLEGVPNTDYLLQSTTNFVDWIDLSTHHTDPSGQVLLSQPFSTAEGVVAFRAKTP